MLNPSIAALANYNQFVLWRAEWDEEKGKWNKIPCSPTGHNIDPHNPNSWLDIEAAIAYSQQTGLGYAFVLTENDPFFCLDIDACVENGQWTPIVYEMLNYLPGAALEQSFSGNGAHLWGAYQGELPERKKRRDDLGLELYTEKRFIALTNNFLQGEVWQDFGPCLQGLVAAYFHKPEGATAADWTNEPRHDWDGYEDDTMLVYAMCKSRSVAALFGTRATAADLWEANPEKLGEFFPTSSYDDFDRNRADAALLSHLAFWTGGNCERMERLFSMSGLNREKWENRPDYRQMSILFAVSGLKEVHKLRQTRPKDETPEQQAAEEQAAISVDVLRKQHAPGSSTSDLGAAQRREGYAIKTIEEQIDLFAGCVYVSGLHQVFIPTGRLLKPEQFNVTYGGYKFVIDAEGKATNKAFDAFTQNQLIKFPQAEELAFRPEKAPGEVFNEDGSILVNTFVPVPADFQQGDVSPFLDFMGRFMPNENDRMILLSYMAAMVQYPGVKFQYTVLLQGTEGNGKSSISRIMAHACGYHYTHFADAQDLGSRFNSWILNKTFIAIEEIKVRGRWEVMERLKWMISNERGPVQGKGTNQITADLRCNFICCSNHKDAITKGKNDRRWCVFYTAQQCADDLLRCGMDENYFKNYYDWLKGGGYDHVAAYLQSFQIPDQFNPATSCQRAPMTSCHDEVMAHSQTLAHEVVKEAIEDYAIGFRNGWVSSVAMSKAINSQIRHYPRNQLRQLMEDLGYYRMDNFMTRGQAPRPSKCPVDGGKKPVMFASLEKMNTPAFAKCAAPTDYMELYEADQVSE
jgi:hypothetical protein